MTAYLNTREAAQRIRSSEDRILRLIASGALRASNVGAGATRPRWIIAADDLDAFVRARANQPSTPTRRRRRQTPTPNYLKIDGGTA
jgi:hypothetical protein